MKNDKGKVRYIRLNVTALEIVELQPDEEKARFLDTMLFCYKKLCTGEKLLPIETKNPYLNLAMEKALPELEEGYKQFARLSSGQRGNQRSTKGQAEVNQWSPKEENREEENINRLDYDITPHPLGMWDSQKAEISEFMEELGLNPDNGFWNTCNYYGYERAIQVINFALSVNKKWTLKGITSLISNGLKNLNSGEIEECLER